MTSIYFIDILIIDSGDDMNKVYDFKWIVKEIDSSVMILLYQDDKMVGGYQATYILAGDMNKLEVKFANIDDLNNFINYAVVRFCDVENKYNIIDIPVRKLKQFYESSNMLGSKKEKIRIKPSELDCFSVINGKNNIDGYMLEIVSYNDVSDELKQIISIANDYQSLDMQGKFDALGSINLTNYKVENSEV